jgi:hypothetical protein
LPSTPPALLISSIASFSASITLFYEIAIVPLEECRMPTFIPSPVALEVTGKPLGLVVVLLGVQDLSNILAAAVDPNIRIWRRRNFLVIKLNHSINLCWICYQVLLVC